MLSLIIIVGQFLIALVLPARKRLIPPFALTTIYAGAALGLVFSVSIPLTMNIANNLTEIHLGLSHWSTIHRMPRCPAHARAVSYALGLFVPIGVRRLWSVDKVLTAGFVTPVAVGLILNATVLRCMYMRYYTYALPAYMILASVGILDVAAALRSLAEGAVGLDSRVACPFRRAFLSSFWAYGSGRAP